jgi:beta-glucosidase
LAALGESAEMSGEAAAGLTIHSQAQRTCYRNCLKPGNQLYWFCLLASLGFSSGKLFPILNTWFAGSEAGNAIADVLFGDENPGKLTATFQEV